MILELNRDFDLVGIGGEHQKESMVLMSKKLCLPINDFIWLPQEEPSSIDESVMP